jgi:hypothetical protein
VRESIEFEEKARIEEERLEHPVYEAILKMVWHWLEFRIIK